MKNSIIGTNQAGSRCRIFSAGPEVFLRRMEKSIFIHAAGQIKEEYIFRQLSFPIEFSTEFKILI